MQPFSEQPRPEDDQIEVKISPLRVTKAGDHYQGEWNSKGQRHGFGKCLIAATKSYYEGYWKHDKFYGRGRIIKQDKTVIEGTFDDDVVITNYTDTEGVSFEG